MKNQPKKAGRGKNVTEGEYQAIKALQRVGKSQGHVARTLGRSYPVVNRAFNAANYAQYKASANQYLGKGVTASKPKQTALPIQQPVVTDSRTPYLATLQGIHKDLQTIVEILTAVRVEQANHSDALEHIASNLPATAKTWGWTRR